MIIKITGNDKIKKVEEFLKENNIEYVLDNEVMYPIRNNLEYLFKTKYKEYIDRLNDKELADLEERITQLLCFNDYIDNSVIDICIESCILKE